MPEYHKQMIEVIIDKESDLYKRICAVAESKGRSVEDVLDTIALTGLAHDMSRRLKIFYEGNEHA